MQNLKIKEFFVNIFVLIVIIIIIALLIPSLVIYSIVSITYVVSEFLTWIISKFWIGLLDDFKEWIKELKPDKEDT